MTIIVLLLLGISSCFENTRKGLKMEYKPKKFAKVTINSSEPNECSPSNYGLAPTWEGIKINAPKEIVIPKDSKDIIIPICGYYCIATIKLMKTLPLKINLRHLKTNTVFSGPLLHKDYSPDSPDPFESEGDEINPEELKDMYSASYFNYNILDHVKIPSLQSGKYEIFVERGKIKSNNMIIKLLKRE